MQKKRVFISSVQSEFANERQMLFDYLTSDALLGKFFEPFIFENAPVSNYSPATVLLYSIHNSIPANPLLAESMYLRGTIERMGTGTEEMANLCIDKGLQKPVFRQHTDFRVILYRNSEKTLDKKDIEKDLSVSQQKIIDEIEKNNNITQKELSEIIGINEKNIRNNIAKLKAKGLIERVGPDKGGYWKIKK